MSFGGGGSGSAATIPPSTEYSKIIKIFQGQQLPAFAQYQAGQPVFGQISGLAQQQAGALPYLQGNLAGAYQQGVTGTQPLPGMIQGAYGNLPNFSQLGGQVQSAYGAATPTSQLTGPLQQTYQSHLAPILQNPYSLPGDLGRAQTQYSLGQAAQAGMANTNTGLAQAVLGRTALEEARYNQALQQAQGITGQVSGLDTAALQRAIGSGQAQAGLGLSGLQAAQGAAGSLYGLATGPLQQANAYSQQQQALNAATAQQLYGSVTGPIGAYGSLFNPVGQNVSSVIGYNLNAQNAANTAASNKTAGAISGAGSAVGGLGQAYASGAFA